MRNKWRDSGYILKDNPTGFVGRLNADYKEEIKHSSIFLAEMKRNRIMIWRRLQVGQDCFVLFGF